MSGISTRLSVPNANSKRKGKSGYNNDERHYDIGVIVNNMMNIRRAKFDIDSHQDNDKIILGKTMKRKDPVGNLILHL